MDVVDPAPFCSALLATAQVDRIDMQITPTGLSLSLSLSPPLLAASLPSASPPLRPSALCADIRLGSCVSTRSFLSGFFLLLPRILGWIFFVCCRIVRWRIFPLGSGPLETPRWILRDFLRFFRILIGVVIFCLFEADPS